MINFNKKNKDNYIKLILFLFSIVFIIIYSSLTDKYRNNISIILTRDISILSFIILITIISCYNVLIGFLLLIIYIIMITPYLLYNNLKLSKTEGFTNLKKDKNYNEMIDILMGKGNRTKKLLNDNKNKKNYNNRKKIIDRLNIDEDNDEPNNNMEKFNDNDELKIKLRKFNPNDEIDNNLKLTISICDDIKNRIKYKYETIDYLKQYISSRIQEIINLLDLTE